MRVILAFWLLLCASVSAAAAETIVLKSGERIDTQGTWEQNGVIKYFHDGVIAEGIPKSAVERIETDAAPAGRQTPSPPPSAPAIDLGAQLAQSTVPKNAIERAGNATVTIKSAIGSGAGFFVTSDGYILTNRHVIQGDAKKMAAMGKKLQAAERYLTRMDKKLKAERRRIEKMEAQIQSNRRYRNAHNADVLKDAQEQYREQYSSYKAREADLQKRQSDFRHLKTTLLIQKTITVVLVDQRELTAAIERYSERLDLAILKLSGYKTPFIRPGRVDAVAQGERLYAIGNPLNFSHSVSAGVFSGHQGGMLMTSAPINAGNSGGPLVTENGEVVGINTMKMVGTGVEGIGFAIPIHATLDAFKDILQPKPGRR